MPGEDVAMVNRRDTTASNPTVASIATPIVAPRDPLDSPRRDVSSTMAKIETIAGSSTQMRDQQVEVTMHFGFGYIDC